MDYLKKEGSTAEQNLAKLQELYGKYKFMENSLVQQQKNLLDKLPDMKTALSALRELVKRRVRFSVGNSSILADPFALSNFSRTLMRNHW